MNNKKISFILSLSALILNFICIIHGVIYLIIPSNIPYWHFAGILFILTIIFNSILVIYYGKINNKNGKNSRFRIASYSFFQFSIIAYFLLFLTNFIGFNIGIGFNFGIGFLIALSYFGIILYPSVLIFLFIFKKQAHLQQEEILVKSKIKKFKIIFKIVIVFGNALGLILGIITNLTILTSIRFGLLSFFFSVFAAMSGIFFGLGFLANTFILVHAIKKKVKFWKIQIIVITSIGMIISSICFVPFFSTPSYIANADIEFSEAFDPSFGGNWKEVISSSGFEGYFLKQPFQLMGYFLGNGNPDCETILDILFFNGSESSYFVDHNIRLYFDAYLPPSDAGTLPGENSVIIRIHGGGWTIGDKGLGNIRMMNKYLAAQGYCVFDVQYGLTNMTNNLGINYSPKNVVGNFTIDDMMRHIGNFTKFLESHSSEYGVNMDSVFVSGGSAGGQLTCAVALSIASGNYTTIFSDQMTIKGIIPFYPANNVSYNFATLSRQEWVNPNLLVNSSSPPCLIFQGEKDFLIEQSRYLKETYISHGRIDCALLTFPLAGHGADIYFPGYYNQVFLYYMERFLYLFH